jgi:ankyrin repeat protein
MIQTLFEKARQESSLANALLADTQKLCPYQSIGVAAFRNHAHIVHYLLSQTHVDITPQLHHRTHKDNMNVLHCAAKSKNPAILHLLVDKFPAGVNELTAGGDTPLNLLVSGASSTVEAVRVLVENGKADVNLTGGEGWYAPLRTAIRRGHVEVARYLTSCGAKVDDAVNVDEVTGKLRLKDRLERPDADTLERILGVLAAASELDVYTVKGGEMSAP